MLPTNPLLNATAPAGPHLPVALLRQYAAGTLAPAAQHRVEAHTLACPRCADILEGLLQTPAATTDQALAQLQQRLRQRVQQAAPARQLVAAPRRHRWLAPQLAAAAALILGLVAAGWWTWQQRRQAPATVAAQYPAAPAERRAAPNNPPPDAEPGSGAAQRAALGTASAPATAQGALGNPPPASSTAQGKLRHGNHPSAIAQAGSATAKRPLAAPKTAPTGRTEQFDSYASAVPAAAPAPSGTADSTAPARSESHREPLAAPAPVVARAPALEPAARLRTTMPAPPVLPATPSGGYAALREYLKQGAAEFEPTSRDGGRQRGRVVVRLHLGADGKIEQAEAVRKLRPDYDTEAVRLLQEGPTWVPGITAGRRAAQVVDVPVVFE